MPNAVSVFNDEQLRVLVNLEQHYSAWIEAERALAELAYGMRWKTVSGREYLYEIADRGGNGKSLGPRSAETEAMLEGYRHRKDDAKGRSEGAREKLGEDCRIYRALRLPLLPAAAAEILREADRRGLLGHRLMVVGTNAMPAYALEAGGRIADAPDQTDDFDLAWRDGDAGDDPQPILSMLKAVDPTYTVNTEKPFQARNRSAYEVEVLVAPSVAAGIHRRERLRPVPLPEQEWLLRGKPVDRIVAGTDRSPARIFAPDPRWYALHKLWMSEQEKRNRNKRPKDLKQGMALLAAIDEEMPHYPLDAAFEAELPPELAEIYTRWRAGREKRPVSGRW